VSAQPPPPPPPNGGFQPGGPKGPGPGAQAVVSNLAAQVVVSNPAALAAVSAPVVVSGPGGPGFGPGVAGFGMGAALAKPVMTALDVNKDGKVSKEGIHGRQRRNSSTIAIRTRKGQDR